MAWTHPAMADITQTWKQGDLDNYLIKIAARSAGNWPGATKPLVTLHPRPGGAKRGQAAGPPRPLELAFR